MFPLLFFLQSKFDERKLRGVLPYFFFFKCHVQQLVWNTQSFLIWKHFPRLFFAGNVEWSQKEAHCISQRLLSYARWEIGIRRWSTNGGVSTNYYPKRTYLNQILMRVENTFIWSSLIMLPAANQRLIHSFGCPFTGCHLEIDWIFIYEYSTCVLSKTEMIYIPINAWTII